MRKSSASAAPSDALFLVLKSSQTFRTFASRMETVETDFFACFSCAVAILVSKNEYVTAITNIFIFIFLLSKPFEANNHESGKVKIPTLAAKNAARMGHPARSLIRKLTRVY